MTPLIMGPLAPVALAAVLNLSHADSLELARPRPATPPPARDLPAQVFARLSPHSELRIEGVAPILYVNESASDPQVAIGWRTLDGSLLDTLHDVAKTRPDSCVVEWEVSRGPTGRETWWLDRTRGLLVCPTPRAWRDSTGGSAAWSFRCPALGVEGMDGRYDRTARALESAPTTTTGGGMPGPNDYVPVDELPEAISKVAPEYPAAAAKAHVEGVVVVKALLDVEGRVGACAVVKSIPELDDAAIASVRQWRFRPALAHGHPVAVWVVVPVKFSRSE